jgi:Mce-associated membrane protein
MSEEGRMRRLTGVIALLVAAAFCAWSGWSYWQSTHSGSVRFAKARDEVRRAGRQEIAALNTLDPGQGDAVLRRWLDASTGPLRDELRRTSGQIRQARTGAQGAVTDLAVTELDERAGTARVIATVQVKLGGEVDRKRFTATLNRTGGAWKLASLTAIPVNASQEGGHP